MSRIKVLIVATNTLFNTGVVNVIKNYCQNIDRREIEFQFCFSKIRDENLKQWFEANLGKTVCIGDRRNTLSYVRNLSKYIKDNNFDIVHIHCNSHLAILELIAAKKAGCPVRMTHSHNTTCSAHFIHNILTWPFLKLCTDRLACGYDAGKWLYGNKSFSVINNGIETSRFVFNEENRKKIREELKYKEEDVVICHVGVFNKQKNHEQLLRIFEKAYKEDNRYKLLLIGQGMLMESMRKKVCEMEIEGVVCLLGNTNCVEKYLSAADAIVMPSLYEGLPLTLIEEQANGLCCVVSDTITREADKTGNVTFLPLDAPIEKWIEVIKTQNTKDRKDRKERSEKAIIDITRAGYDIKEEATKLLSVYIKAYDRETEDRTI